MISTFQRISGSRLATWLFFFCVFLTNFPGQARGKDGPKTAREASPLPRGPAPAWAPLPQNPADATKVPTDWLEEHGAIYLHNSSRQKLETDGSITSCTTQIIRLLGRKAIAVLGDHKEILFDPGFEICTLNQAFVIGTDGQKRELEPRHCQVRDMVTDYAVYQNEKQAILSFPGLQVGDSVVVQWTIRGRNPEYRGECFGRYSLGMVGYPTLEEVVQIGVPAGKKLHARLTGASFPPETRSLDGTDWTTWKCGKLDPLEVDDAQSADLRDLEPEVSFSTFPDWKAVGKWQNSLRPDLWTVSPPIAALVEKILVTGGKPQTDLEKAKLLARWVKRNIRYLSVGDGHHFTPHSPMAVLANRHGDCKDTAQLLAVMLRHAGLKVEMASLGVKGDGNVDEAIPSPWATHALVAVQLEGKLHWIDTTEDLTGWDQLNEMDLDRLCYLVNPEGECRLVRSPSARPEDCRWQVVNRMKILRNGDAEVLRTVTATGEAAVVYRDAFLEEPPARRKKFMQEQLQDFSSQVEVVKLTVNPENLQDFDAPLQFECKLRLKGLFSTPEAMELVAVPLCEHLGWDSWLGKKVRFPSGDKLMRQGQPLQVESVFEIELEKGLEISELPEESRLITTWGSLSRSVKSDPSGQKFTLRFRASRTSAGVPGKERSQFLEFLEAARDLWQAVLPLQVSKAGRP